MRHIEINQVLYKSTKNELTSSEHGTDETKFSLYRGAKVTTPEAEINLAALYHEITRSDKVRRQITAVRNSADDDARKAAKAQLPAVSVAGVFSQRNDQALIHYAGLIVLDFDDVPQPEQARDILARCAGCALAFVSPSGTGVKAIFRHDGKAEHHAHTFRQIAASVERLTGLTADKSGKDLSRLCYLSHDPDARFNPDAAPFAVTPPDKPAATKADYPATATAGGTDESFNAAQAQRIIETHFANFDGGFVDGNRDNAITSVVGKLNVLGVSFAVAEPALRAHLEHHPQGAKRESRKARNPLAGAAWVDGKLRKARRMYRDYAAEHGAQRKESYRKPAPPKARYELIVNEYLTEADDRLTAILDTSGNGRALLVAPTGSGKTTFILWWLLRRTGRVSLLSVPNTTTAAQLAAKFPGVIGAYEGSGWRRDWRKNGFFALEAGGAVVFVCTYDQTALIYAGVGAAGGRVDCVVMDEFHEATNAAAYRAKAVDGVLKCGFDARAFILMTATPPEYTHDFLGQGWTTIRVKQLKAKAINVRFETHWNLDRVAMAILTAVKTGAPVVWARINSKADIETLRAKLSSNTWAKKRGFASALDALQIAVLTSDTRRDSYTAQAVIETGRTPNSVRVVLATQLIDSGLSILDTDATVFWVDTDPHNPPTPQAFVQFANRFRNMARVNIRAYFHATVGTFADGAPRPRGSYDPDEHAVNYYKCEAGLNWHLNNEAEAQGFKVGAAGAAPDHVADLRNGVLNFAGGRFGADGHTRPIETLRIANERSARRLTLAGFTEACTALDPRITFEWTDADWTPDTDEKGDPLPDLQERAVAALQKHGREALYLLAGNLTHLQTLAQYARHVLRWRGRFCGFYADDRRKPDGLDERSDELATQLKALLAALPEIIKADAVDAVEHLTTPELFSLCKLKEVLDHISYIRAENGATHADAVRVAADNQGAAKWGEYLATIQTAVAVECGAIGVSKRVGRRLDAGRNLAAYAVLKGFEGRRAALREILDALDAAGLYGWNEKRLGSLIRALYADAKKPRVRLPDGRQVRLWTFSQAHTIETAVRRYFDAAADKIAGNLRRRAVAAAVTFSPDCATFGYLKNPNNQTWQPPPDKPEERPDWVVYADEIRAESVFRAHARPD